MPKTVLKPEDCGSLSCGTMKTGDLYEAYSSALEELWPEKAAELASEYADIEMTAWLFYQDNHTLVMDDLHNHVLYDLNEDAYDQLCWYVDELAEALEELAPDGYYFGAHWGDGADFGWWPSDDPDHWDENGNYIEPTEEVQVREDLL